MRLKGKGMPQLAGKWQILTTRTGATAMKEGVSYLMEKKSPSQLQ